MVANRICHGYIFSNDQVKLTDFLAVTRDRPITVAEKTAVSTKLIRVVQMQEVINRGGYPTVEDFQRMFEVAPRTVYQDISYLRDNFHMKIEYCRYRNGYFN